MASKRPVYLNLAQIKLPLPALVSILHRVSGMLLFLFIPFLLYLLQHSLGSPEKFTALQSWLSHPLMKLVMLGLTWAFLHHFFAGLRFLLLDLHLGTELRQARLLSVAVLVLSLALTVIFAAVWLW